MAPPRPWTSCGTWRCAIRTSLPVERPGAGEEADLRRAAGKSWASGAVRLMTLHGAKGLEFPVVFLSGVSAGMLPLEPQGRSADMQRSAGCSTWGSPGQRRS